MENSKKNTPSRLVVITVLVLIVMILGYLVLTMLLPDMFQKLDNPK